MSLTPYADHRALVWHGDCLAVLRMLPEGSADSIVTDPPYGLGFMGKKWDELPPGEDWAAECLRVLKPGGHLLAFGGTRTWHRLAVAVEDAGFEIRDSIAWMYGSGFPKSLDVSKAIDKRRDWKSLPLLQGKIKAARTELGISQSEAARRVGLIGPDESLGGGGFMWFETGMRIPTAVQYAHLKSALGLDGECDRVFEEAEREVLSSTSTSRTEDGSWANQVRSGMFKEGGRTIEVTAPATPDAEQWQGWGTALKPAFEPIVVARKPLAGTVAANVLEHGTGALNIDACRIGDEVITQHGRGDSENTSMSGRNYAEDAGRAWSGRWPANVVLDESQAAALDEQTADQRAAKPSKSGSATGDKFPGLYGTGMQGEGKIQGYDDSGGASRFFYVAKAPKSERPAVDGVVHPTVKPLTLMRWLVRLVTPPNGLVYDTFAGSGTTGEACLLEGLRCLLIEREAEYLPLIAARLTAHNTTGAAE